jgi:hypothetical protein
VLFPNEPVGFETYESPKFNHKVPSFFKILLT